MASFVNEEELIEILSIQTIKPSSPTPTHLRNYNLSFFDQMLPQYYFNLLFYYEAPNLSQAQTSQTLKDSLSNVLSDYPLLAGTFNPEENLTIECDDSGVDYIEVRVHSRLSITLENRDTEELKKYVGIGINRSSIKTLFGVHVNYFDCGGIAVGVSISHKIADAVSLLGFMNAWAKSARNEKKTDDHDHKPIFNLHIHFPPVDSSKFVSKKPQTDHASGKNSTRIKKMVSKWFVFDKEMLSVLKAGAMADYGESSHEVVLKIPTNVEALTIFICRSLMIADRSEEKREKNDTIFVARHAVNVRPRTNPPLTSSCFGNVSLHAFALFENSNDEQSIKYHVLLPKLRNSFQEIDLDFIEKMKNPDEYLSHYGKLDALCFDLKGSCSFTSWCRFPVYEVNYGWGDPLWVSPIGVVPKNLAVFMDAKSGDGKEAWLNLGEEQMEMMEKSYQKLMEASKK